LLWRFFERAAMPPSDRFLLAAVMGWPIAQSRSPMLHNYWFEKHGLPGSYVPLAVPPERLQAALRALPALNFSGCNLTIPLKQDAMRIVDEVDVTAKKIGAISCVVVRPDGSLAGSNNDWFGFVHNILDFVPDWRADAGPVAVMGAGGGARAVVYGLMERAAREIRLCNRTLARAQTLAKEFGGPIQVLPWEQRHDAIEGVAMLVNATSQGMVGQAPLDLRLDKLPRGALVNDIIYIPRETPLIVAARARGNRTVTGLGMLLHQGIPAWKAWFGIEPKVTAELRARIEATL
jgi:shikimate dehydrogenase